MPDDVVAQAVDCQRCGHSFLAHGPACTGSGPQYADCACPGFRWVDPAPAPDRLGYHRLA